MTDPSGDLGRVAARALGWSTVNTAVARFGTVAIGIVLARLLGPTEFGTFAVATVALLAVLSFNELGVSLAIVRWRSDPAEIFGTVNLLSVVSSAILTTGVVALAPWFCTLMGSPDAVPVVRMMALAIIVNGVVAGPAALLQRQFAQRRRMLADQLSTWIGAALSITLALLGMGAMSLAVGRVAGTLVSAAVLLGASPLRYRLTFDRRVVSSLLRFGMPLAGSSAVVFLAAYIDQLVTGARLGPTALGVYVLAVNLAGWPATLFSQPLRSVVPALLSRLQQDEPGVGAESFRNLLVVVVAVTLPLCAALSTGAPAVVRLLYGPVWGDAARPLTLLAAAAAVRIVGELVYDALVVARRSLSILLVQLATVAVTVPLTWLGAVRFGVAGVAAAQLTAVVIVLAPSYLTALRRAGIRLAPAGVDLATSVVGAGLVVFVCRLVVTMVASAPLAAVGCGLTGVVAAGLLLLRFRPRLTSLQNLRSAPTTVAA